MAGLKRFFTGDDATTGDITNDLTGMGVSDEEARYYENEQQAGHSVIAVQAEGREQEAEELLRTNGASTYGTRHAATQTTGMTQTTASADATRTAQAHTHAADTSEERVLRLREEQLNVNKQRTQIGEVQLGKEIVSERKTLNVPVTHEEAFIEHRAITGTAASDTTPIGEGESMRVPLSEERVNVRKETVITGEVSIGKRAVEETQQVTDTVRREEAHVEQQGDAPIHGIKSDRFHPNSGNEDPLL